MKNYEYEQLARQNDPLAKWICCALFLISLGLIITSINVENYRFLYQCGALFLLTAAIFITSKYILRTFVYRTERQESGDYDLIITEVKANKQNLLVRLSFEKQITGYTDDEEQIRRVRKQRKIPCYLYCTQMSPKNACLLYAKDGDDRIAIIMQPNPAMREALRSLFAGLNREE